MSELPSIDDFIEELPSVEEFIKEENLPSIDEFIEKEEEEVVEEKKECGEGEYFCNDEQKCKPIPTGHKVLPDGELVKESQDLTEVLQLINAVRRDIPQIPEIKCYDEELKQLAEQVEQVRGSIPEIPEIRYYDDQVESICEAINLLRGTVKDLPEVKYYDEQLDGVEDKIDLIQQEITNLPQPKYYEEDFAAIRGELQLIRDEIPTFPKWVNEVNEVPDFSWIGKTFSVIDDDFVKVGDNIKDLRDRFDADFKDLSESLDTKDFEKRVQIDEVKADIKETNERIFKELKEAAIKIWSHHDMFKDDDRKLKKQVLSKLNETKQRIEEKILDSRTKSYEENKVLEKYFEGLQKEISALPEVKYYDTPIRDLKKEVSKLDEKVGSKLDDTTFNIAELYKIVGELKEGQHELKEIYNDRPLTPDPALKQGKDPLTPTDQQFATLQDLAANYRLFVNRVEQQLYTIGGGGAGFLKDLDDVNIDGLANNDTIIWNSSTEKWDVGSVSSGSTSWVTNSTGIVTTSSVGIGTTNAATELYVKGDATITGDLNVTGDIVYDEQTARNLDVTGIATIANLGVTSTTTTQDLAVSAGATVSGLFTAQDVLVSNASTITGRLTAQDVLVSNASTITGDLKVSGDAHIVGILTVGESSVTIDGDNNVVAASNFTVGVGGTNLFTELSGKTSIGLAIALGG